MMPAPRTPVSGKTHFWLWFGLSFFDFGYLMILGGYIWRGNYSVQLTGLILALVTGFAWLFWRGIIRKDHLPLTGAEWAIGFGLLAMVLSLVASPDPRQGFSRVGWLASYALFFPFFISILQSNDRRWGALAGLVAVVGLVLAQALAETLNWYQDWFRLVGTFTLPQFQYRFSGILSSSIPLIALGNLFMPAMIFAQWKFKRPAVRVLAGLWLVIFFMIVPFSSSRGGWLGVVVSLTSWAAFWAWRAHLAQRVLSWPRRKLFLAIAVVVLLLIAGVLAAQKFMVIFGSHPSHGGSAFSDSGRSIFWANALKMWRASPWFGTGPGRFGLAYLEFQPGIPPGFWPVHAHNLFFQALAEFGLLGLAALIFLIVSIVFTAVRKFRQAGAADAPWIAAFMAGLAGMSTQLLFDEFTTWIAVIVPGVFVLAWVCSVPGSQPERARFRLAWLALPAALLIALAGWELWAYQPVSTAYQPILKGDWSMAVSRTAESAARDPGFHFYQAEAGLLAAWEWEYQRDPAALSNARAYLERAVALEPGPSWLWADLAVLDFAAGQSSTALARMDRAIAISPALPEYYLNRGYLHERLNQVGAAENDYRMALELAPEWANHPFWDLSATRQKTRDALRPQFEEKQSSPGNANSDSLAEKISAQLGLGKPPALQQLADAFMSGNLSPQAEPGAFESLETAAMREMAEKHYYLEPGLNFFYAAMISNRTGMGIQIVPGFIQISGNYEQIDVLQKLVAYHKQRGECDKANQLARLRQQLIQGYGPEPIEEIRVCQ